MPLVNFLICLVIQHQVQLSRLNGGRMGGGVHAGRVVACFRGVILTMAVNK